MVQIKCIFAYLIWRKRISRMIKCMYTCMFKLASDTIVRMLNHKEWKKDN